MIRFAQKIKSIIRGSGIRVPLMVHIALHVEHQISIME